MAKETWENWHVHQPTNWGKAADKQEPLAICEGSLRDICFFPNTEQSHADAHDIVNCVKHMENILDVLQTIARFPDSDDSVDRVMNFRWTAVNHARYALELLAPIIPPQKLDEDEEEYIDQGVSLHFVGNDPPDIETDLE